MGRTRLLAKTGSVGMTESAPAHQGLEVRRLAATLLRSCIERRLTVEEAINGSDAALRLEPRDRSLLSTLLLTTFRHYGEIDAILSKLLDRPLPRRSGTTREILEVGVTQLSFLDMPPHAVIDLAVRSAKMDRNALHFSGLINAVLRKVSGAGAALRDDVDAARCNTPSWLWERWSKTYGDDITRRIALAHAERPGLDISFRDDPGPWLSVLPGERLPNGQIRLAPGHASVPELRGFREGAWWVQDTAATIPVRLLGDIQGRSVLDLCAAPGGKTLQMASLGAEVTAVDLSEGRLRRLRDNLSRTGLSADIRVEDVLSGKLQGHWDAVLLDAPCSATGTIRRHPELPYLKQASQIAELVSLQRRMLRKAAELVRPGGLLVYCTCSLEPEEGEAQMRWFLGWDDRYAVLPPYPDLLPANSVRPEGWVRTLPCMDYGSARGMDGFFALALRRRD